MTPAQTPGSSCVFAWCSSASCVILKPLSMQFTRWDDMTDAEKELVEKMGKRGQTVIREQKRAVVGHGLLGAGEAARRVAAAIPYRFNTRHFLDAGRRKSIRPAAAANDPHPERTDEKYCLYVELSKSYGYTQAWVDWLIKNCSTSAGFESTTGREAMPNAQEAQTCHRLADSPPSTTTHPRSAASTGRPRVLGVRTAAADGRVAGPTYARTYCLEPGWVRCGNRRLDAFTGSRYQSHAAGFNAPLYAPQSAREDGGR
ncbi:hypothetical protein GCM10010522_31470 [Kribbella solani]